MPRKVTECTGRRVQACQWCPHLRFFTLGGCCLHPSHAACEATAPVWVLTPEIISHSPQPRSQGVMALPSCHNPPCFSGCIRPRVSGCTGRTFLRPHIPCKANPRENAPACTAAPSCTSPVEEAQLSLLWPSPAGPWVG